MTKVCFCSPHIYNLIIGENKGFGGAEVQIYNLAKNLAKEDEFKVSVVCVTPKIQKPQETDNFVVVPVEPYTGQAVRRGKYITYIRSLFSSLRKEKADIYFGCLASLESIITFFIAKIYRKKFIYRIAHDWETNYESLKNKIFNGKTRLDKILPFLFVKSLRCADAIIAPKQNQKISLINNLRIKQNKITQISNMVELPAIYEKTPQSILWVNRIHPVKKPLYFVKLAGLFPNERFIMIGPPNPGYEVLFNEIQIRGNKLNNFDFVPGVPRQEIIEYYRSAKIFILTSMTEGLSNVLIEALSTGIPVISLFEDPDNILTNHKIGFCAEGDFDLLVQYLGQLIADKIIWEKYSQRAIQFARNNYDVNKIVKKYKEFILRTLP